MTLFTGEGLPSAMHIICDLRFHEMHIEECTHTSDTTIAGSSSSDKDTNVEPYGGTVQLG